MKLTKEDLTGTLANYPLALAQLIVDRILEQYPHRSLNRIVGSSLDSLDSLCIWGRTREGGKFWAAIDEGDFTPYFERYCKVKPEDLKGEITNFPIEVVQLMCQRQVEQHNDFNPEVFASSTWTDKHSGGLNWKETIEGLDFWERVISCRDFGLFFKTYPDLGYKPVVLEFSDSFGGKTTTVIGGLITNGCQTFPVTEIEAVCEKFDVPRRFKSEVLGRMAQVFDPEASVDGVNPYDWVRENYPALTLVDTICTYKGLRFSVRSVDLGNPHPLQLVLMDKLEDPLPVIYRAKFEVCGDCWWLYDATHPDVVGRTSVLFVQDFKFEGGRTWDDVISGRKPTEPQVEDQPEIQVETQEVEPEPQPEEQAQRTEESQPVEPVGHPHAEAFIAYGEDSRTSREAWKNWEFSLDNGSSWVACSGEPSWSLDRLYRRKPNVIKVTLESGEVLEIPKPMKEAPQLGTFYWYVGDEVHRNAWAGSQRGFEALDRGLVYKTEVEARAAFDAYQKIRNQ